MKVGYLYWSSVFAVIPKKQVPMSVTERMCQQEKSRQAKIKTFLLPCPYKGFQQKVSPRLTVCLTPQDPDQKPMSSYLNIQIRNVSSYLNIQIRDVSSYLKGLDKKWIHLLQTNQSIYHRCASHFIPDTVKLTT